MSISFRITVFEALNSQPLAGASVSIDGVAIPGITDSSGIIDGTITGDGSQITVEVRANGFITDSVVVFVTLGDTGQEKSIFLQREGRDLIENFRILFNPKEQAITWTMTGSLIEDRGASSAHKGVAQVGNIVSGIYIITASLAGYESFTGSVTIQPGQTSVIINLVKTSDLGITSEENLTAPTEDVLVSGGTPTSVPPDKEEYIYPGDSNRYLSSTQARLYIGNLFIDEINTVQFALQQNTVPVYSYASSFADAYGKGRSLVQGQIALNFVTEGYLPTVLSEYKRLFLEKSEREKDQIDLNAASLLNIRAKRETLKVQLAELRGQSSVFALETDLDNFLVEDLERSITEQLRLLDIEENRLVSEAPPEMIRKALKKERETLRQLTSFRTISTRYGNAVYEPVVFDIELLLGEGSHAVKRRIEKCKLISNEQVYDQSGSVLLDVYGFVGRRLR